MRMTSSAARGSLRPNPAAGSKSKGPPRGLRPRLAGARHGDHDLLAFVNIARGDLGRCAVADTEANPDRGGFLASQHIDCAFTAAPAALALAGRAVAAAVATTAGGGAGTLRTVLSLGGRWGLWLVLRRSKAQGGIRYLQNAIFAADHEQHVGGHARLEQQLFIVDAHDRVVGDDVLDHDRRVAHWSTLPWKRRVG